MGERVRSGRALTVTIYKATLAIQGKIVHFQIFYAYVYRYLTYGDMAYLPASATKCNRKSGNLLSYKTAANGRSNLLRPLRA